MPLELSVLACCQYGDVRGISPDTVDIFPTSGVSDFPGQLLTIPRLGLFTIASLEERSLLSSTLPPRIYLDVAAGLTVLTLSDGLPSLPWLP